MDEQKVEHDWEQLRRGDGQAGACCRPEIPAAEYSIQHQARPASCPSETIACLLSQPALTASPQARTAQPTGDVQVTQRQDGRQAEAPGAGSGLGVDQGISAPSFASLRRTNSMNWFKPAAGLS